MNKVIVLLLMGTGFLLGGVASGFAAQNVANPSQKGSLLIFPRIDTTNRTDTVTQIPILRDTIIRISNDYPRDTYLQCYWMYEDGEVDGFMFLITSSQPAWFRASDGVGAGVYAGDTAINNPIQVAPFGEDRVGELKCWAVNAAGTEQSAWNHLTGTAMVLDYTAHTAYEYNSLNFTVRPAGYSIGAAVPPAGDLVLSAKSKEYDACPAYLLFNFFTDDVAHERYLGFGGPGGEASAILTGRSNLTLVPCHRDLRQDRSPTCTKAKFDLWNENEVKLSGAYQCLKCWFEGYLRDVGTAEGPPGGFGGELFTWQGLHTTLGRLRVQGVASTVCRGVFTETGADGQTVDTCWTNPADTRYRGQVATPLLGILVTEIGFSGGGAYSLLGTTGSGAGTGATAHILWDPAQATPEGVPR